jgi:hypothetical protein
MSPQLPRIVAEVRNGSWVVSVTITVPNGNYETEFWMPSEEKVLEGSTLTDVLNHMVDLAVERYKR